MAEIDSLELKIIADATSASARIDRFVASLERLSVAMAGIQNANGINQVATGISNLGTAMQGIASIDSRKFATLASNIDKLGTIGGSQLSAAANGIFDLVVALDSVNGTTPETSANVANLANAIGRLGSANIERAVENIPRLTTALRDMLTSLSAAPQISRNVIEMTNALANLAMQSRGMQTTTTNVSTGIEKLTKSAKTSSHTLGGLAAAFGKFYATYFLLIRGVKKLWAATESAMDYVETFNYYSVALDKVGKTTARAFGEMGENDAQAYTDEFTKKLKELNKKMTGYIVGDNGELINSESIGLGLNPEKLMNFQAQILGITNSVGLLGDASTNTAKALSMLSSDLSSLTNTDLETVMGNLRSGLIGQSRALYKYGIDITSATLKQYALAYGIQKSVTEMSQSEKMQLRMLAILDQSRIAWGDQARTINTVANQYRILKQQVSNLGRIIGNLFLPIISKVLPYINAFIILLQRLFTMLGFKLWGDSWLKDLNKDISSIGGGADDIEDLSDSLDDAADSAKKLKGQLLGIDELNVLNTKDNGGAGKLAGLGGGIDLSDAIGDALAEYEKVWNEALQEAQNKAEQIANAIAGFFKEVFSVPDTVKENVKEIFQNMLRIAEVNRRIFSDPEIQEKVQKLGRQALATLKSYKDSALEIVTNLTVGVSEGIANAKEDLEGFDKVVLGSILDSITRFLSGIEKLNKAFATISKAFKSSGFAGLIEKFAKLLDVTLKPVIDTLIGVLSDLFNLLAEPISDNAEDLATVLEDIFDIVNDLLTPLETVLDLLAEGYEGYENSGLHKFLSELASFNSDTMHNALQLVKDDLESVKESADNFAAFWSSDFAKNAIANTVDEWQTKISTLANINVLVLSNMEQLPQMIALVFGRVTNAIGAWFSDLIGKIERWGTRLSTSFVAWTMQLPDKIWQWLVKTAQKFTMFAAGLVNWAQTNLPTVATHIANAFNRLPTMLYEIGKNAIVGLWNGIVDWWNNATSRVTKFTDGIANAFRKGFDEHSPSKVFFEIGAYATEGLKLGMESLYDDTLRSVKDFTGELTQAPKINYDLSANVNPSTAKIEASADIATALKPIMIDAMNEAFGNNQTIVNVTLEGDTDKIFKVVKDKSQDFTKRTGLPAFS